MSSIADFYRFSFRDDTSLTFPEITPSEPSRFSTVKATFTYVGDITAQYLHLSYAPNIITYEGKSLVTTESYIPSVNPLTIDLFTIDGIGYAMWPKGDSDFIIEVSGNASIDESFGDETCAVKFIGDSSVTITLHNDR